MQIVEVLDRFFPATHQRAEGHWWTQFLRTESGIFARLALTVPCRAGPTFLGFLTYIGTIAAIVQIVEMVLDRFFPATHQRAEGHWWTQSLRNESDTSNFLTHAGTTFALKALAATGLPES